jgi:hypothetical protein
LITNINTSAFTDGEQLYLSPTTAGALTATKPYAPNHLVYVAIVEHAHPTQGKLFVKIQNGYELDELHNVSAQSPSNGQTIIYNASTSLWEKANLTAGTGISVSNGAGSITVTNSAPDQTVALTGAGTTSITGTYPNFTITSNDAYTGTVTSVTGTSPVISSGGNTPAISLASGYGDTQNPYASKTANYVLAAPNGSSGVPTFRAVVAADIPTLNQNTTGTASNVTGIVAIANGGSGQTTATAAFNALAPSQASNSGKYLTTDGTNTSWVTVSSGGFTAGTAMLFQQTSAPTGWTKQTTHNDKALRVVSGTASSGGTTAFSTVFANQTPTITTSGLSAAATTLAESQIPSHTHTVPVKTGTGGNAGTTPVTTTFVSNGTVTSNATGGGGSHTHSISGSATSSAITLNVQYVDLIIATKD